MSPAKRPAAPSAKDSVKGERVGARTKKLLDPDMRRDLRSARSSDVLHFESLWDRQLRRALGRLEIAQDRLKTAKTKQDVDVAKNGADASMLLAGGGYGPASNKWMRSEDQKLLELKMRRDLRSVNTAKRQLQLALKQQGLAQDQWKTAQDQWKNAVEAGDQACGLWSSLRQVNEAFCAAVVHAGLHCNLLVASTSVATVRRSALVQILERYSMPPEKRPAAPSVEDRVKGSFLELQLLEAFSSAGESPWEKQLRLALKEKETALQEKAIALGRLQKATEANDKNDIAEAEKKVEAAEKKVEAAKKEVEAAKKEVVAGPAQELPTPSSKTKVGLLQLGEFKADELLDVKDFMDFVAPNTTADRPLFLRKHLLNVHEKAVEALQSEHKRLVSLVGCPGTGKTWCGWLVAYTLQKVGKKTLHLTIRNSDVTAIANFQVKKQYEEVSWNGHMLKQVLRESKCQVCIVDVSMNKPDAAMDIFTGIQQLIERNEEEFAGVKFMGLLSGHGQEKITGKQLSLQVIQKLVLWSWREEEVATLCTKLKDAGSEPPSDEAYKVCGGSVRYLFRHEEEAKRTRDAVKGLSQDEMKRLLALDMPLDDQQGKNRSRLLSFFPSRGASNAVDEYFAEGVSEARPMPRSDFVIKCIKQNKHAKFEEVLNMYKELSNMNAGAAGCAFELLVHLFWRDAAATKQRVELSLTGEEIATVEVDCAEFPQRPQSIEEYDKEAVAVLNELEGYFTPDSPRFPVLDSILRYKSAGKIEVLAIQISIAATHEHGKLANPPKLLTSRSGSDKLRLALWDFPPDKRCNWKPNKSEHWKRLHVGCKAFDERMLQR
ncbi:unnamed protein product [Symbiodinium sp. CCMP2592]|nr:unnamed protein product [Symbiodinium sp. CCMP2592]